MVREVRFRPENVVDKKLISKSFTNITVHKHLLRYIYFLQAALTTRYRELSTIA